TGRSGEGGHGRRRGSADGNDRQCLVCSSYARCANSAGSDETTTRSRSLSDATICSGIGPVFDGKPSSCNDYTEEHRRNQYEYQQERRMMATSNLSERRAVWPMIKPYIAVFDGPLALVVFLILATGTVAMYSAGMNFPGRIEDHLRNILISFAV